MLLAFTNKGRVISRHCIKHHHQIFPCKCLHWCKQSAGMQVLTYGIASAAILRLIMVLLGAELIDNFQPILLGFAALLLYSSYKLLVRGGGDVDGDLSENNIVKLCRYRQSPPAAVLQHL